MKHKVGDVVRIKPLEWYNENKDEVGCIGAFVPEMTKYCGKEATITESYSLIGYMIDIDDNNWYWSDAMFE